MQRINSKPKLSRGRKEVREIIEACKAVEERRFNPFFIDIKDAIQTLRNYYPLWRSLEDYSMDAEALKSLSKVLSLQNSLLLYRSSRLYADPEIVSSRIKRLTTAKLAEIFLKSFHPTIEMEQLTSQIVYEALSYWSQMTPYTLRSRRISLGGEAKTLSMTDLEAMGIAEQRSFQERLKDLYSELKRMCPKGPVKYSRFIRLNADRESEMVERAYLTSFLLTSGKASLMRDIDGDLWIWISPEEYKGEAESVPIPVKIGGEAND